MSRAKRLVIDDILDGVPEVETEVATEVVIKVEVPSPKSMVERLTTSETIGEAMEADKQAKLSAEQHLTAALPPRTSGVRDIDVRCLVESPTNPRKAFTGVEELAASMRSVGVLSPLLVRKLFQVDASTGGDANRFEIIFGHRRLRAAVLAGLPEVPCEVRDLTDVQVMEAQLIENVQRADIHPLEEAEAYQQLIEAAGYTADQLAQKTGRSRAWVYSRLKLCALGPEARMALINGKLPPSVAVPLARLPTHKLQAKAVERICGGDEPWAARDAIAWLQTEFVVSLKGAPFDKKDEMLVEGAVACAACPKCSKSGQPGLFEDLATGDWCTDTICFNAKSRAAWEEKAEKYAKAGAQVLTPAEGKRLFKSGALAYGTRYVAADEPVHEDSKRRTWAELMEKVAKDAPPVVVAPDADLKAHKLYDADLALAAAATLGLGWAKKKVEHVEKVERASTAEETQLKDVRAMVVRDVLMRAAKALKGEGLETKHARLLVRALDSSLRPQEGSAALEVLRGAPLETFIEKGSRNDLLAFAFVALVEDWCGSVYAGFDDGMVETAKAFGLDLEAMAAAQLDALKKDEKRSEAKDAAEALFEKEK